VSLKGAYFPFSIKWDFEVTNNVAKYKACIGRLHAAIKICVKGLRVYKESNLKINQISQKWKVRSEVLAPHQAYVYWDDNQFANTLHS